MKVLMKYMVLSCKKAAELISKKLNGNITPMERIKLRMHNKMCAVCQHFEDQQKLVDKALKSQIKKDLNKRLDEETKNKIKGAIEKES
jgi:hypothetical protein